MAIYTSKFTQQEIDDGIDNANSAVQPEALEGYLPLTAGTTKPLTGNLFIKKATMAELYFGQTNTTNGCGVLTQYETDGRIGLHFFNNDNILTLLTNGNVGIGTTSPSYKLHVNGKIGLNDMIYITGSDDKGLSIQPQIGEYYSFGASNAGGYVWGGANGVYLRFKNKKVGVLTSNPSYDLHVAGAVGATAYNNTSDIRKKDIIENLGIDVEDIANAPLFKFSWLDPEMPEGVNVGTSAQYWQTIIPEIVSEANDDEKTLSMQYGVAGLASSIALARKVVEQENIIKAQEARIKALEDAIAEIQNKLK